jgi:hypothetical protein
MEAVTVELVLPRPSAWVDQTELTSITKSLNDETMNVLWIVSVIQIEELSKALPHP